GVPARASAPIDLQLERAAPMRIAPALPVCAARAVKLNDQRPLALRAVVLRYPERKRLTTPIHPGAIRPLDRSALLRERPGIQLERPAPPRHTIGLQRELRRHASRLLQRAFKLLGQVPKPAVGCVIVRGPAPLAGPCERVPSKDDGIIRDDQRRLTSHRFRYVGPRS